MNKQENKVVRLGREDINTLKFDTTLALREALLHTKVCIRCLMHDIKRSNELTLKRQELTHDSNEDNLIQVLENDVLFKDVTNDLYEDLYELSSLITFKKYCEIGHAIRLGLNVSRYCKGDLTEIEIVFDN